MKYRSIVFGALTAAVLLSISMTLNYRNTSKIREFNLAVDRAENAISTLRSLLAALKDAETGQRGYLLTGDEEYLTPYRESIGSIETTLADVESHLTEIPSITKIFPELQTLVGDLLAELEETIELRRERGYQSAARVFDNDTGRILMDRIRVLITDLVDSEKLLLAQRLDDAQEAYKIAIASGLISGLSALVAIAALFLLVRRHVDERESTSRKISEQSELFRTTLACIGDGVITTDQGGRITSLNEVAEEITGWTADEAVGASIKKIFPVYYAESGKEASHPVLASIHSEDIVQSSPDTQLLTKKGKKVFVDCSASPIETDDEQSIGCVLTFKDTTGPRKREALLQKSESRLRVAFENAAVGIAHVHPDERLFQVNQRLCEIIGYSEEELIGRKFSEITHPQDLELTKTSLTNMLTGEYRSQRFQKRYLRKDGDVVWVNKTISLVRDSENKPDYYIMIVEDITDRIIAQDALRESESHMRRVLDNTLAYIGILSTDGTLLDINKAALELGDLDHEECVGQPFENLPWWGKDDFVAQRISSAIKRASTGEIVRYDESIHTADNTTTTVDFIINPARDEDGKITHLIATGVDVSERKRLEEELRIVAAELSQANKRKDEFLATLAHELRNPMAPIRTGLEILRLNRDDPVSIEETREMMERQTEQLIRLVDDLLDVSRITRGKLELRKEDVPLKNIVERALESSRPLIQSCGHQLSVEFKDNDTVLNADPHRLAQVISNLLNNAAKYTNDGGKIALSTWREEEQVAISVKDSGIGIQREMLEFVFEMFGQVKNSDELVSSGLGIGLTLARSLTEQHGGSISVSSEGLNKGSEFTIRIPVKKTEATPSKPSPAPQADPKTPRRVLVVDDSTSIQKTMSMVIKLSGHEVYTASDGHEAIEKVEALEPDIVFMDIGMPRTNGYEAAKTIRQRHSDSSLILVALTGWGGEEVSQRIHEAGFDHHVVKPPEPDTLRSLIASAHPKSRSPRKTDNG